MTGQSSSIDELFTFESEYREHEVAPRRPTTVRLLSLLLIAGIWTGAVLGVLRLSELTAPLPVIIAGALAVTLLGRLARGLRPPPMRLAGRHVTDEPRRSAGDGLRSAQRRWEIMFENAETDSDRFQRRVLPKLAELADERLRQRHGITRATDPELARSVLGDPLWGFLAAPGRRPPQRRELEQMVDALEKL